jgi:glycosyltransferase involved in cell wall biosynthesis
MIESGHFSPNIAKMSERSDSDSNLQFSGRLGLQQRIFPIYRADFFSELARACQGGMQLFAGDPLESEGITQADRLDNAQVYRTKNRHFFSPSSPLYLCWQDGLLKWLKSWQPEILIMEANPRYISSYLALQYANKVGIPVIGWGLGAPPSAGVIGTFLDWERRLFLNSFDALIAYSHYGAREFRKLGFPSKNIFIASNAVAHRPKDLPPEKPEYISDPAVVLFVGRLQQRKRVDLLIQACHDIPETLQPRLKIVGDGPARLELETLASKIYPKAEFLGAVHGPQLIPVYSSADLFVLPGTGGLAIQEAMANGLPVIVARGDGTQEDLVRPENGWQIPADDLPALRQTLVEALSDLHRLRGMGEVSHRIVKNEINIETMVSVFMDAISAVTTERRLNG